jgi:hypothetical protein
MSSRSRTDARDERSHHPFTPSCLLPGNGEAEAYGHRRILLADVVAPVAIASLHAQRVEREVSGVTERVIRARRRHDVEDVLRELRGRQSRCAAPENVSADILRHDNPL